MRKKNIAFSLLCCLMATVMVACSQTTGGGGLVMEDMGPGNSVGGSTSDSVEPEIPDNPPEVPSEIELGIPKAVYFDVENKILSWADDTDAKNGWLVQIKNGETLCVNESVATPSVALDTLSVGEYLAQIQAKAVEGEFLASPVFSYTFTVGADIENGTPTNKMPQATGFVYDREEDLLAWEEVQGNNGYVLEVYSEDTRVLRYDGTVAGMDVSSLSLGDYTAKLIVSGNGITIADSDTSVLEFSISSFGVLSAPSNLKVAGGMLTWDKLPHTNGVEVRVGEYHTGNQVSARLVVENNHKLSLAELGVSSGNYKISVAWKSIRHDTSVSDFSEYGIAMEYAVRYTPEDIVGFAGELPVGEHGGVRLVEKDGQKFAEIYPTKDGWGRVGGNEFTLDFDRNPIVFISVGHVYGGYHLQLKEGDTTYLVVPDSNRLGNLSADIVEKTGLQGKSKVYLRLGVNGSTSTDANDARVHYSGISVFYAEEILPPESVKLDAVTDMKLNRFGELTWNGPTNGECNAYDVCVKIKGTDTIVYEGEISKTAFGLYQLNDGIYTVSVKAKNTLWETIRSSDESTFDVKVSSAVRYSAQDLDTETGLFETGAQGIKANYDAEKGYTLFNATNKTDWGWISPKTGITVDMSKNPLVVINTLGMRGGFFAKQEFDGQSIADVRSNTSASYDGEGTHVIRANVNSGNQNADTVTWSGVQTGYKFHLGSLGKADGSYKETCQIYLTGLNIVYVEAYIEPPLSPTKLATPTDFSVKGTLVTAKGVEGNSAYTPVYEISVQGKGVSYKMETSAIPGVDTKNLSLVYGEKYTVSVKALGDGVYFSDSETVSIEIRYGVTKEITDFTEIGVSKREGEGSILSQDENGLVYGASDGKWVLFAIEIPFSDFDENCVLELAFGEITDGTRLAGRYYTDEDGAENTYNLGGDSAIASNETRYYKMDKAELSDGNFYLGLGMGGDAGERQIHLTAIRVWALEIVGEV